MAQIQCRTGEIVYSYEDYLKTKHWKVIKSEYKKRHRYQCTLCFSDKNLQLHHMTYKNIGREKFTDLVYLCEGCHIKIHKTLDAEKTKVLGRFVEKTSKVKKVKANCQNCFHNKGNFCQYYYVANPDKPKCRKYSKKIIDPNPGFKQPKVGRGGKKLTKSTFKILSREFNFDFNSKFCEENFHETNKSQIDIGRGFFVEVKEITYSYYVLSFYLNKDFRGSYLIYKD